MRVARSYDEPDDAAFRRFATAVMKYWVSKRAAGARGRGARVPGRQRVRRGLGNAAAVSRRAAELDLGGIGQRRGARRAARDGERARGPTRVPVGVRARGRWRRAPRRPPQACAPTRQRRCSTTSEPQFHARRIVEDLAVALQGSLLVRHAPPAGGRRVLRERLAGDGGRVYGTLPGRRRRRGDHRARAARYERAGHLRGGGPDRAAHAQPS